MKQHVCPRGLFAGSCSSGRSLGREQMSALVCPLTFLLQLFPYALQAWMGFHVVDWFIFDCTYACIYNLKRKKKKALFYIYLISSIFLSSHFLCNEFPRQQSSLLDEVQTTALYLPYLVQKKCKFTS